MLSPVLFLRGALIAWRAIILCAFTLCVAEWCADSLRSSSTIRAPPFAFQRCVLLALRAMPQHALHSIAKCSASCKGYRMAQILTVVRIVFGDSTTCFAFLVLPCSVPEAIESDDTFYITP